MKLAPPVIQPPSRVWRMLSVKWARAVTAGRQFFLNRYIGILLNIDWTRFVKQSFANPVHNMPIEVFRHSFANPVPKRNANGQLHGQSSYKPPQSCWFYRASQVSHHPQPQPLTKGYTFLFTSCPQKVTREKPAVPFRQRQNQGSGKQYLHGPTVVLRGIWEAKPSDEHGIDFTL